jgi:caspase domain-containing protein
MNLLGKGQVVAVVVGIENYRPQRRGGTLSKVDFAGKDAQEFAATLESIYPTERLNLTELRDTAASCTGLSDELQHAIRSLAEDDLFIFYYAGHGFHGAGGNRITAWDSNAHNIEGTTLLLRDILTDPLAVSPCNRALAFIDACASGFDRIWKARDVIASMDQQELKDFLGSATYSALFLSCKPGEKSFPSSELQHGIWTYFLLKALRGEDEDALGPERYLTDTSLRDYLRKEVAAFITGHMQIRGVQTPQAIIDATNTFAIRHVPARVLPVAPAGDLSRIAAPVTKEYMEGIQGGTITSLKGFTRGLGHFVPKAVTDAATKFVRDLLTDKVNEEIQEVYEGVKTVFGLRRSDIPHSSANGQGSLDTEFFRFSIDTAQDEDDPAKYVIIRRLELRDTPDAHVEEIDTIFGSKFDEVVVEVDPNALDFGELVSLFEDVVQAYDGELKDEEHTGRLTYTAPDSTRIKIDSTRGRLSLAGTGRQPYSALLARVRQYRFGLTGDVRLML